jgi:hypothetical protein
MGATTVDDEIENLHARIRQAEAIKAVYPDAYLGTLPGGGVVWMSDTMEDCNEIEFLAGEERRPAVYAVPYTILRTENTEARVFKSIRFGGLAYGAVSRLRHNFPEAYKALVQCAVSEAR